MQAAVNASGTLQKLERKKNGTPEETRNRLTSCQPPKTLSTGPLTFKKRFPFPTGRSYISDNWRICGTSSTERLVSLALIRRNRTLSPRPNHGHALHTVGSRKEL